jgi:hypothetical protein
MNPPMVFEKSNNMRSKSMSSGLLCSVIVRGLIYSLFTSRTSGARSLYENSLCYIGIEKNSFSFLIEGNAIFRNSLHKISAEMNIPRVGMLVGKYFPRLSSLRTRPFSDSNMPLR